MKQFWFLTLAYPLLYMTAVVGLSAQNANLPQNDANAAATEGAITLPAGVVISVRISNEVNSNRDHPGDMFIGKVDPPVFLENQVVIPRGTEARIQMVDVKKGGHFHGKAEVELQLVSLVLNGERTDVDTDAVEKKKGSLSTKAQAEVKPGAAGAAETAASINPVGAVALGGIAAFKAAKVVIKSGSPIPFILSAPFTFNPPPVTQPSADDNQSKKKRH